jgi:cytochrome P450
MIYSVSYIVLSVVVAYVVFKILDRQRKLRLLNAAPVKGGIPFLGNVLEMINGSPWDVMTAWSQKYGRIYRFHMFGSDAIVISDPASLKVILNTKLSIFRKDLEWTYKPFLVILGNGIVTAHGDSWRHQRNLLSKVLRIDILDVIPDMALSAIQRLCVKIDNAIKAGNTLDMSDEFRHLTLQVIAQAVLSLDAKESDDTFAHMYLPIVEEGNNRTWNPVRTYLPTPAWFHFNTAVKTLNDYVSGLIQARWRLLGTESARGSDRAKDLLDVVLGGVEKSSWGDAACRQICDEVKTFILAGHETSASMLTWALYELSLSHNADSLKRVRAEAEEVYGSGIKTIADVKLPNRDALSKLVFTECCLRESLRKYSNVPSVVRVSSEEVDLGNGHVLPKGTTVMVNIQGVHHDEEFWPEPLVYKPDRFLGEIKPYTFLPFAEGPRMCLGQFLSLLESKVVLSLLVLLYDFKATNADAGVKHPFMVPIIPKSGHHMKISKR